MPQGSVIGNHHEIELVPPDVRAPSLSCEISSYQIPTMSCLSSRHASWSVTCQLEGQMAYFDYGAAAELFPGRQRTKMMATVAYIRFAAAAEAIRYAVEEIPANSFLGTFLEVNEERFDCNIAAIAALSLSDTDLAGSLPLRLYKTAQSAWLIGSFSNSCSRASFPARLAVTMV